MTATLSAIDIRTSLNSVSDEVFAELLSYDPRVRGGSQDAATVYATQDILGDWLAQWYHCEQSATTLAGIRHVDAHRQRAERARDWLVRSVLPLAHTIVDRSNPAVVDEMVQEMMAKLLTQLPRFSSRRSRFHQWAAICLRHAQSAAYEAAYGGNTRGIPDSWMSVSRKVRAYLAQGLSVADAAAQVKRDLCGVPEDSDFDARTARHVRSGHVSALEQVHAVLEATSHTVSFDQQLSPGSDDGSPRTLGDTLSAPPVMRTLDARVAELCGLSGDEVGDSLSRRFGFEGTGVATRRDAVAGTMVTAQAVGRREREIRQRVVDPLAWFVWLDPRGTPSGEVRAVVDQPVVW